MKGLVKYILISAICILTNNTYAQMLEHIVYQPPVVPKTVTTQSGRVKYITRTYWNNFDFSDTSLIENKRYSEGAYAEFVKLTSLLSNDALLKSYSEMLKSASANREMMDYFVNLSDKYLLEGDSLLMDSVRYKSLITTFVGQKSLSPSLRSRYAARIEMMTPKVEIPEPAIAPDIEFTRPDLTVNNLYSLRNDYTLLFLRGEDRLAEVEMEVAIQIDSLLFADRNVDIVAVSRGEDVESWSTEEMPKWWINGFDENSTMAESKFYRDIEELPTLFLLDKRKRVIFNGEKLQTIVDYFNKL